MKSLGVSIGKSASSKAITAIGALALTFLTIRYIYVYKNVVKLQESSLQSPSQVVWHTHANNLSYTKTVQLAYREYQRLDLYQRLDFVQENLLSGPHRCGCHKCLFPLKTDPRIGYLVKGERKEKARIDSKEKAMIDSFNISKNIIEEKYGMNHMYLAPPKRIHVSLDFQRWMEMDMRKHDMTKFIPVKRKPGSWNCVPVFTKHSEVLVQAVSIVPEEDSVLLKGLPPSLEGVEKMFDPKNNHESWNITDVEITVKRDFALLYRLVEVEDKNDDKLSCLCSDFQIFLHRSGHLIHLDVDRCFENRDVVPCGPKLQEMETMVLNRLQKSRSEQEQSKG